MWRAILRASSRSVESLGARESSKEMAKKQKLTKKQIEARAKAAEERERRQKEAQEAM